MKSQWRKPQYQFAQFFLLTKSFPFKIKKHDVNLTIGKHQNSGVGWDSGTTTTNVKIIIDGEVVGVHHLLILVMVDG